MVSFSLSAVVDKYNKQTINNELGELWLIDEKQQVIINRDSEFNGRNIKDILKNSSEAKMDFSSDKGGYFESMVLLNNKKHQHSIIAYYPLLNGDKRWTLLVVAPYSQVISPLRKTFILHAFQFIIAHYCSYNCQHVFCL